MLRRRSTPISKKAQQWLEYAGVRLLAVILRVLGVDRASNLMGWVWRKIGPHTRRQSRVVRNLELAFPDRSAVELAQIADAQWDNLGRTFAESFLVDRFVHDPGRFTFLSEGALDDVIRNKQGFVVVGLHTGNWEVALAPFVHDFRLIGLYQRLTNPLVDSFVLRQRKHVFTNGLLSKKRDTITKAMQFVREGGVVAVLADTRERKGIKVEFFGRTVTANPFPAMIARRLNVPLFVGRAIRLDGATFAIDGLEVNIPYTDDVSDDVLQATQIIHGQFEEWIREYPGQWMWVQDRWRQGRQNAETRTLDK